jgi:hypothetical protein
MFQRLRFSKTPCREVTGRYVGGREKGRPKVESKILHGLNRLLVMM